MSSSLIVTAILKHVNYLALISTLLFLLDISLPTQKIDTLVTSVYRPNQLSVRGVSAERKSSEEVIVKTQEGLVKVSPNYLNKLKKQDSIVVHKTLVYGLIKGLLLPDNPRFKESSNLIYSWFIFFPITVAVLSGVLIFSSGTTNVNLSATNLTLFLFCLFLLLKDHFR